jgi:RES domain-containing protein
MASRSENTLSAWRIADSRYPIFDGGGAARSGGRWNSPGCWVIYASSTFSGAVLEIMVHLNIGVIPRNYEYVEIRIPRLVKTETLGRDSVAGWDADDQIASRQYGDAWYRSKRTAVLVAPSVVNPFEPNILINQNHPDVRRIRPGTPAPVPWDERLFRRRRP